MNGEMTEKHRGAETAHPPRPSARGEGGSTGRISRRGLVAAVGGLWMGAAFSPAARAFAGPASATAKPWMPNRSGHPFHVGVITNHLARVKARHEAWLGRPLDIAGAFGGGARATWEDIRGGPGADPGLRLGQLGVTGRRQLRDPRIWPPELPTYEIVWPVPRSHGNRRKGGRWANPGIWAEIAAGRYDAHYTMLFRRLALWDREIGRHPSRIVLDLGHEMTGAHFPHSIGPHTEDYIRAWRHIVDILRREYGRVWGGGIAPLVCWRPNPALEFGRGPRVERLWNAYPGDAWVDVVGLSLHDRTGIADLGDWKAYLHYPGPGVFGRRREGFQDFFDWAADRGKWLCSPETGANNPTSRGSFPPTRDLAAWVAGLAALIARHAERWLFHLYMDQGRHAISRPAFRRWAEPYRAWLGA